MVGMSDVAAAAGVSHGTVSHALNHPERVSAETLARVRAAVDELGYVRNDSARQLRSGRSTTLGLVLVDNWSPFFNELSRGFEDAVVPERWNVTVANSALDVDREIAHLDAFEQRRVAGILIIPQSRRTYERLIQMRRRGISCVLVDQQSEIADLPSVGVDDYAGGFSAARHLVDLGRRRIAFVGNPAVLSHARARLEGARAGAGEEATIETIEVSRLEFDPGLEAGRQIASRSRRDRPDAVFCANDLLALGVIQVAFETGLRVPEDLAVIGYDDIGFATRVGMGITSVRQPAYELGKTAGRVLLDDIARREAPQHIVYTPELIPRASTLGRDADGTPN